MSALPPPPPPPVPPAWSPWGAPDPWPPPPPPPPAARKPWWLVVLATVVALALVAGMLTVVVRWIQGDGPGHPDEWDPRVADLAAYVERERELEFDHPVYVDFLSPAEYTEATLAGGPAEEDARAELELYASQLRALGVASGELDLYEAFNTVVDSGTLAFYDPADERIRVRGTEVTVGLEVTLVHELTHALQDQRFELDRVQDPTLDTGASAAFRALGEGDALRVENAYIEDELDEDQQAAYDEEFAGDLAESEAATGDVPPYIEATFGAPYALGQPFVTMLFNDAGNAAVDEAFEDPPYTEEHLFDPASFLADEGASEVEVALPRGAETVEEGPFGATAWYLVLAERIDPKVAFDAALGWDGDHYAAYERGDEVCVQAVFAGATAHDESEMAVALEEWQETMPGDRAEVTRVDGHPGIDTCDPGEDVDLELTGRSETSLYLPNLWGYLVADASTVLDADGCRCYARAVIEELTYEQISGPDDDFYLSRTFQDLLERAQSSCS